MIDDDGATPPPKTEAPPTEPEVHHYARGEIRSYHGRVNTWLLAVYALLVVWGVYYLVTFWGGLGPGLAR